MISLRTNGKHAMSNSQSKLDKLIEQAMNNAVDDRDEINKFIANLLKESLSRPNKKKDEFGHDEMVLKNHELAPLLIKQYETKLKANEQLIKLANILQKDRAARSKEEEDFLDSFDADNMYESIESEEVVLSIDED